MRKASNKSSLTPLTELIRTQASFSHLFPQDFVGELYRRSRIRSVAIIFGILSIFNFSSLIFLKKAFELLQVGHIVNFGGVIIRQDLF